MIPYASGTTLVNLSYPILSSAATYSRFYHSRAYTYYCNSKSWIAITTPKFQFCPSLSACLILLCSDIFFLIQVLPLAHLPFTYLYCWTLLHPDETFPTRLLTWNNSLLWTSGGHSEHTLGLNCNVIILIKSYWENNSSQLNEYLDANKEGTRRDRNYCLPEVMSSEAWDPLFILYVCRYSSVKWTY